MAFIFYTKQMPQIYKLENIHVQPNKGKNEET